MSGNNVTAQTANIKPTVTVSGGDSIIMPPILQAKLTIPEHQYFHVVIILISSARLIPFIEQESTSLPRGFIRLIEEAPGDLYFHEGKITPAIRIVLHQILNCPYTGAMKHLYLEAKALELVFLRIEQVLETEKWNVSLKLRPSDRERIHHAKDILIREMVNPPSLTELSREVGLNVKKLKIGFREVFGTTAFSYLREQRLTFARYILMQGDMNVTETAHLVGYQNLSAFATAFRRQFGVNPGSISKINP
jgi:AraC-like DNA-binding protein